MIAPFAFCSDGFLIKTGEGLVRIVKFFRSGGEKIIRNTLLPLNEDTKAGLRIGAPVALGDLDGMNLNGIIQGRRCSGNVFHATSFAMDTAWVNGPKYLESFLVREPIA